jgi:hypothetical protein
VILEQLGISAVAPQGVRWLVAGNVHHFEDRCAFASRRGQEPGSQGMAWKKRAGVQAGPRCIGLDDPDHAARKLIANAGGGGSGRPHLHRRVNGPFLEEGGTPDQFRAALTLAIKLGWLWLHESGTYVKFTAAGAELFA